MHAGEKIRKRYLSAGLNRHSFAQRAGVAYDRLIDWEAGQTIELVSLRKCAHALDCAVVDLMNDDDLGATLDRDEDPRARSPYPDVDAFIVEMLHKGQMTPVQASELANGLRFSNAALATRGAAADELRAIVRRESGIESAPRLGTVADTKTGAASRNVRALGLVKKKSR